VFLFYFGLTKLFAHTHPLSIRILHFCSPLIIGLTLKKTKLSLPLSSSVLPVFKENSKTSISSFSLLLVKSAKRNLILIH